MIIFDESSVGGRPTIDVEADAVWTPVSALSKSFIRGAAQLSMDPGWHDPSAAESTDTGGNGAKVATNQPGAGFRIGWTGQRVVAIAFDDISSAVNANGKAWRFQAPYCSVRLKTDGVWGNWIDGVRPVLGPTGGIFFHDLVEASSYEAEVVISHFYDPVGGGFSGPFARLEYMRPPSLFPGGSAAGDGLLVEQGGWTQISGLWGTGGTWNVVDDTATPALNVIVVTDSRGVGQVDWVPGQPFVEIAFPGSTTGQTVRYDAKGVRRGFLWKLLDDWCTANNRRCVRSIAGYGGLWVGDMSANTRYLYLSTHPGLASNVRQRWSKRNGYTANNYPTYTPAGRPLPAGFTPHVIMIDMASNDQIIGNALIDLPPQLGGDGTPQEFGGTIFRDNFVSLVNEMRTAHPAVKAFVANTQRADGSLGGFSNEFDTKQRLHQACGPGYLNFDALRSGSPSSWGRYVDLEAANACAKTQLHPTGPEHDAFAAYAATAFNALMAL